MIETNIQTMQPDHTPRPSPDPAPRPSAEPASSSAVPAATDAKLTATGVRPADARSADTRSADTASFIRILNNPFKFRLYLFSKIPSAYFSGLRIREADPDHCAVTVPYRRFTKNPFRSTYFACLAMAAEASTGCLAMAHLYRRHPSVSMLVTGMEARFFKKATGLTTFLCTDGAAILQAIERAATTGEAQTIQVRTTGTNSGGEEIAGFLITWSFKLRQA